MRILLIEPAKSARTIGGEDIFLFEPLGLEYVAAGVSDEHEVRILDMRLDKDLSRVLEEFNPNVVGATAYTVHVNVVKDLLKKVKDWNPQVLTVIGGHHATVLPEDFAIPFIDLIVMGEGVFPFKEIVARFASGRDFTGIPGVAFARDGKLVRTDPTPVADLDSLPFPARHLTAAYRKQYYSEWMKPLASIRTSNGCPHRCSFCALWKLTGGRYLKRKPESVVEELAGIEEKFVFFADDESLVDAERMATVARLIKEAGIKKRYFLYGRSDTIARNPRLLAEWKDIGLERVFVGLEFFRDEDLKYVGKGSSVDDNEKAIGILKGLGIDIYASFIVRPELSKADFTAFGRYCRERVGGFATFSVLTPLPGTDFYEEVKDRLITHNYDHFDFIHTLLPTALPLKEFYEEYVKLYQTAIPLGARLAMIPKFSPRQIGPALASSRAVMKRIKEAYLDYDDTVEQQR